MLRKPWGMGPCILPRILKLSAATLFLGASAFCQPGKSSLVFDSVDIHASKPGDQFTTLGILPNGRVYFRNASPRKIIAAAYDLDEGLITGGPEWLDSDRLDLTATTAPAASRSDRLA